MATHTKSQKPTQNDDYRDTLIVFLILALLASLGYGAYEHMQYSKINAGDSTGSSSTNNSGGSGASNKNGGNKSSTTPEPQPSPGAGISDQPGDTQKNSGASMKVPAPGDNNANKPSTPANGAPANDNTGTNNNPNQKNGN